MIHWFAKESIPITYHNRENKSKILSISNYMAPTSDIYTATGEMQRFLCVRGMQSPMQPELGKSVPDSRGPVHLRFMLISKCHPPEFFNGNLFPARKKAGRLPGTLSFDDPSRSDIPIPVIGIGQRRYGNMSCSGTGMDELPVSQVNSNV